MEVNNRVVDLVQEGVDVALRVRPTLDDSGSLIIKNLGNTQGLLVASPQQLERQGRPQTVEDLQRLSTVANADADRANVLNELAQVERTSGRPARAQARAAEARALLRRDGPPMILATNHREMGRALVKKDAGAAEKELRTAMRIFRDAGAARDAAATARDLAKVLRDRKKPREALAVLEEGLDAALQAD
jgi:DNA-binding transcriptional LysR family regulator